MKHTTTLFLLVILFFTACKKSPQSYTSKMAGIHHWHGTESGTHYGGHYAGTTYNFTNTITRTDTITIYSENAIEMRGQDFELIEANSSSKFLLFKEEFHGSSTITYYYSENTFKYEENTGQSHIELVSP
jgi:hypothetical protein